MWWKEALIGTTRLNSGIVNFRITLTIVWYTHSISIKVNHFVFLALTLCVCVEWGTCLSVNALLRQHNMMPEETLGDGPCLPLCLRQGLLSPGKSLLISLKLHWDYCYMLQCPIGCESGRLNSGPLASAVPALPIEIWYPSFTSLMLI